MEIEVKLHVPDLDAVAQRLERVGAVLTAPRVFERNVRYENLKKTLSESGIVVRLREDSRVRLTYKEPPLDRESAKDGILARFEAEVEVSDFDTMSLILGRLGYFPNMVYEKYRTTYQWDAVEVVLDEMPYGNFVEIEGDVPAIEAAIKALELEDMTRYPASYVAIFRNIKKNLSLGFNDLTFANFDGVSISPTAFHT